MTDSDLDQSYTALCEALAEVGEARASLFLAMACLSLMSRLPSAADVLPLIANARVQCLGDGGANLQGPGNVDGPRH